MRSLRRFLPSVAAHGWLFAGRDDEYDGIAIEVRWLCWIFSANAGRLTGERPDA